MSKYLHTVTESEYTHKEGEPIEPIPPVLLNGKPDHDWELVAAIPQRTWKPAANQYVNGVIWYWKAKISYA